MYGVLYVVFHCYNVRDISTKYISEDYDRSKYNDINTAD